jgi:hypothetical protein
MQRESVSNIARIVFAFTCGPISIEKFAIVLPMLFVYHSTIAAKADSCRGVGDEIATDRPDVTNSSVVVPAGSLQIENGVNFSLRAGDRFVDGTNTRLRAGFAPCLEFLVDTPTYFANVRSAEKSGFSDVAPALKWQISPIPGKSISPRYLVWHCRPDRSA